MGEKTFNRKSQVTLRKKLRNNPPIAEVILWRYLKGSQLKGYKFRRQQGIGNYVLDFYCPILNLAIEIDGDSHFNRKADVRDHARQKYIESQGITMIRFTNTEIYKNLDSVLEIISFHLP